MPRLSCWFVRASLVYLVAGFTLGALMLEQKAVGVEPAIWRVAPAHIEFLLVGWVIQLVMGVAYWILPRFGRGPARGKLTAAWLAFILVNAGVLVAGIGSALSTSHLPGVAGRLAELAGAMSFGVHAWPRVKPTEIRARE